MATDLSLEKTLPNNLDAERWILGAILLDDKALFPVQEILRKEYFYLDSHRKIYEKMITLTSAGKAIDLITLMDELRRSNLVESAGGPAYLASLTDGLPRAANVEYYAQIVKEKATLRRLIQISNEITARSYQNEESPQEILESAEKVIFELAGQQFRTGFLPIEPLVSDVYKQIEEVANRRTPVTGIETGFTELDKMTAGLHRCDLIVDYLQLMSGTGPRYENRTQEISQISRGLKALAKDLNVPVLAISQLNRAVESRKGDRRPQLSDLRESGSIEQDADLVLFIYREDEVNPTQENSGVAEIIIGKQRNGPTGKLELAFIQQFTKFANLWQEP